MSTCPKCGGPKKKPHSKTCRPCDLAGRAESGKAIRTCPNCGQYKHRNATVCKSCYEATLTPASPCACGKPKSLQAKTCRACFEAAQSKAARTCKSCDAVMTWKNTTGLCDTCYRAKKSAGAAPRRICECGQPKKALSKRCIGCHLASLAGTSSTSVVCECGRAKDRRSVKCAECRGPAGTKVCPTCSGPKSTTSKQCTTCRRAEERAALDHLVEDVEWLIEAREWPERIAERVGQRRDTLVRRLQNNGRSDLANYLDAVNPDEARRAS